MAKILLVEYLLVRPQSTELKESTGRRGYIVETSGDEIRVKIPATILDELNDNGRKYSAVVMQAAIDRAKPALEAKELLSTVDEHPESPRVTPGLASHVVTKAWIEGNTLWNEWLILETNNGNNLRALTKAGAAFGVSIRGLGSQDPFGNIMEDYEYLGTDCVGQPSARIRPRAEVVEAAGTLSKGGTNRDRGVNMSGTKDIKQYVTEQATLMKADPDKISAFRRAAAVEDQLAEYKGDPRILVEAFNVWEIAKKDILGETAAPASADARNKTYTPEQVEDLIQRQSRTARLFRKVMAESEAENERTRKQLEATTASLSVVQGKLDVAVKRYNTAANVAARDRAVTRSAKGRMENLANKYEAIVAIAAEDRVKYGIAIKEAAKALVERNDLRESYGLLVTMAGRAIKEGRVTVESLGITLPPKSEPAAPAGTVTESLTDPKSGIVRIVKPSDEVSKKPISRKNGMTDAYMSGEVRVPGFI